MRDTLHSQVGPYAAIPVWILDRCKDANAIHVYAILARRANQERRAWPGNERIAADMGGVSTRTVQRGLDVLRQAGAIVTEPRRNQNGVILGTQYVLLAKHHETQVSHGSQGVVTRDERTTSGYDTSGGRGVTQVSEELDPVNQIQKEERDPARACETAIEGWRRRWQTKYGHAATLITSPVVLADVGRQVQMLGLDGWERALDGYFATDDVFVKRCVHGLNTFAKDPNRWRAVPEQATARTAEEARQQTQRANATHVADGRLQDILARDNPEMFK